MDLKFNDFDIQNRFIQTKDSLSIKNYRQALMILLADKKFSNFF